MVTTLHCLLGRLWADQLELPVETYSVAVYVPLPPRIQLSSALLDAAFLGVPGISDLRADSAMGNPHDHEWLAIPEHGERASCFVQVKLQTRGKMKKPLQDVFITRAEPVDELPQARSRMGQVPAKPHLAGAPQCTGDALPSPHDTLRLRNLRPIEMRQWPRLIAAV